MDINNLTSGQLAELETQLEARRKADAARVTKERETYKQLVDETVGEQVEELRRCSDLILQCKERVFASFDSLVAMKSELYGVKGGQRTHTFTNSGGALSITMGNRVNEGWDDTVQEGVEKVKEYVASMARDENSANLVDTVLGLLAKDRKGNLKASKVLELEKLAVKTGDANFLDGIRIIKEAYRPTPTCRFVEAGWKDADGRWVNIPLSMSAINVAEH